MEAIFHGHAFVELKINSEGKEYTILIDPFINGNGQCDVKVDEMKCDYIILTHAHGDHYGDTEEIAKNNDATIISNAEICDYVASKGLKASHMHIGGANSFPFGKVKFTIAHHGSSFPDGTYGGNPTGVIITNNGTTVYHAGDTGLFYDMKLIGEMNKVNLAFLPIGDNYTMGIDDAVKATEFINADTAVPIHYDTFDEIQSDPQEFKKKVESIGKKSVVMKPGDKIEI